MRPDDITSYITRTFPGVDVVVKAGDSFFIYDPHRDFPDNKRQPFATLVTGDNHDTVSNLSRDGVYRLNVGVAKATYLSHFGAPPAEGDTPMYDFTALDRLMPHPVYNRQFWVCVLSPTDDTFEQTVKPLLAEAYDVVVKRYGKK